MTDCPDVIPSLLGFACRIGVTKDTIHKWKARDPNQLDDEKWPQFREFLYLLERLNDLQEVVVLDKGLSGQINASVARLILSKHGYNGKVDVQDAVTVRLVSYKPDQGELNE